MGYLRGQTGTVAGSPGDPLVITLDVGDEPGRKAVILIGQENVGSPAVSTVTRDLGGDDQVAVLAGSGGALIPGEAYQITEIWYMDLTATGSQTFTIQPPAGGFRMAGIVEIWDGLAAGHPEGAGANPYDGAQTVNGAGTSIADTITPVAANAVVFTAVSGGRASSTAPTWTPADGQTERADLVADEICQFAAGDLVVETPAETEIGWTHATSQAALVSVLVSWAPAAGGDPPDAPSISVAASAEDTIRATLSALPTGADEVRIYGAASMGVSQTDTLIGTLTGAGDVFWTGRDPATEYFLIARAVNEDGGTNGTEQSATTFDDDFEASGLDEAEIVIPFSLLEGQTADDIRIRVGELIRASSGLGRTRSLAVEVTDGEDEVIGSDTLTGSDITNVEGGEEHIIAIDPGVEGPQTITVRATVSIDPA